jgi:hypothetical protein
MAVTRSRRVGLPQGRFEEYGPESGASGIRGPRKIADFVGWIAGRRLSARCKSARIGVSNPTECTTTQGKLLSFPLFRPFKGPPKKPQGFAGSSRSEDLPRASRPHAEGDAKPRSGPERR